MAENYTPLAFSPMPIEDQVSGSPSPTYSSHATNHSDPPSHSSLFQHRETDRECHGSDSPRSKVTQRLKNLDLSNQQDGHGGGGVSDPNNDNKETETRFNPSLGQPSLQPTSPSPAGVDGTQDADIPGNVTSDGMDLDSKVDDQYSENAAKQNSPTTGDFDQASVIPSGDSSSAQSADNTKHVISHKSGLPLSHRSEFKSKARRRTNGTPPPSWKRKKTPALSDEGQTIVDPVRAELTWHQDEITVYDPNDQDDDGTGVNGIGFKQTHAHAQRLKQRRRQQLAEYRKREENDARAKRSVRRRGHKGDGHSLQRKHSIIRVHFSEAEPSTVLTT